MRGIAPVGGTDKFIRPLRHLPRILEVQRNGSKGYGLY
jgi:hypothetical protein